MASEDAVPAIWASTEFRQLLANGQFGRAMAAIRREKA